MSNYACITHVVICVAHLQCVYFLFRKANTSSESDSSVDPVDSSNDPSSIVSLKKKQRKVDPSRWRNVKIEKVSRVPEDINGFKVLRDQCARWQFNTRR